MAALGTIVPGLGILGEGASFAGSLSEAGAQRTAGEFARNQANFNARMSEMQAEDALKRGNKEAKELEKQGKKLIGAQRAALAAQGIDIGDGSALDVQLDTAEAVAQDALTIKNNAWREAFGFRVQAVEDRFGGEFDALEAQGKATETVLSGGLSAFKEIGSGLGSIDKELRGRKKKVDPFLKIAAKRKSVGGAGSGGMGGL